MPVGRDLLSQDDLVSCRKSLEEQRNRWMALHSVAGKFTSKVVFIHKGKKEGEDSGGLKRGGVMELMFQPSGDVNHPFSMLWHLAEGSTGWHFAYNGNGNNQDPNQVWESQSQYSMASHAQERAFIERFLPFGAMEKPAGLFKSLYRDGEQDNFLRTDMWRPKRRSSPEETQNRFNGEQQYLYIFENDAPNTDIWVSAVTGEIRQWQRHSAVEKVDLVFSYENYVTQNNTHFPTRFVATCTQGTGDKQEGWIRTFELTDIKLNEGVDGNAFKKP
jgi:hypothetical protein